MTQYIELWTYGEVESEIDYGISFTVPETWLKEKIKDFQFTNLSEFIDTYLWDISEEIMNDAELEGVLINKKCGKFGHII